MIKAGIATLGRITKASALWLPKRLLGRLFGETEPLAGPFVGQLVRRYRRLAAVAFSANLAAAVFEGSTIAFITLALQILTGSEASSFAAELGRLGQVADYLLTFMGKTGLFFLVLALAVATQVIRSGLQFGGVIASTRMQIRIQGDIHLEIFNQIMKISFADVSRYQVGDLNKYFEHTVQVSKIIGVLNTVLYTLLLIITYACALLWLSLPMSIAALVVFVLLSTSLGSIIGRVRRTAKQFMKSSVELSSRTVEFLQGLRLVRVFAREDYAAENVKSVLGESLEALQRGTIWKASIAPLMESIVVLGIASFLGAGYLLLGAQGHSALPRLGAFVYVLYRLLPLVNRLNNDRAIIANYMPAIERVSGILCTDDKAYMVDGGRPFQGLKESIQFCKVTINYIEGERPAVRELSFTVPCGSMVALVGESGAGKSTVADLLLRLYDPTKGVILVDGVELPELDLRAWRNHIGVVNQDTFLFNETIRNNIRFGKLGASEEQILAAARAANAHDFIMELAEGYQTVIGDRGFRLSGGQRQRIALARAILRDPDILVLDEATSDLDSHSERLIQQALEDLRSNRTILVIAHRLSTVSMAERILVLEEGRIIEQGTHEQLLAMDSKYSYLWHLQSESGKGQASIVTQHGAKK